MNLDYKTFVKNLFHSVTKVNDSVSTITDKLKLCLLNKGFIKTLKLLHSLFEASDDQRTVTLKSFERINQEEKLKLKPDEIEKIFFAFYDCNSLNFKDFFMSLIDPLTKDKEIYLNYSWNILSDNKDEEDLSKIIDIFDPTKYPESDADPNDIFEEFSEGISIVSEVFPLVYDQKNSKKSISRLAFINYYRILSLFIPNLSDLQSYIDEPFDLESIKERNEKSKTKDKPKKEEIQPINIDASHMKTLSSLKTKLLKLDKLFFVKLNNFFLSVDLQKNKLISNNLFEKAIKLTNTSIIKNEVSYLYSLFEDETSGLINYETFLRTMINMNYRIPIISSLFNSLYNKSLNGISVKLLLNSMQADNHPEVLNGDNDKEEIFDDFEEALKINFNLDNFSFSDSIIGKNDFINFFLSYYADTKKDELFDIIINNCWKLSDETYEFITEKQEEIKQNEKGKRLGVQYEDKHHENGKVPFGYDKKVNLADFNPSKKTKIQSKELQKFISLIVKRGSRGIFSLRRTFDITDKNKSGTIDFDEFKDLLSVLRLDLSLQEVENLFDEFDKDKNKEISYEEFIEAILGEFPEERETRLKQVFFILDKDNSGLISIDELKDGFNYKRHPDVLKGKRKPEEIYSEFLDNVEYYFNLLTNDDTKEMKFSSFVDFYRNISLSYTSKDEFSDYLKAVWGLEN